VYISTIIKTVKQMTLQQDSKLSDIAEAIRAKGYLDMPYGFRVIDGLWKRAMQLNRKQNDLLKSGDTDEVVRQFTLKDEELGECVCVSVKASKNYSRLEWFQLLCADYQFYTIQQVKRHLTFTNPKKQVCYSDGVTVCSCNGLCRNK
jgi:hypothetical protein